MPACNPDALTQGRHQEVGSSDDTSVTMAWTRPMSIGSALLITTPRNLP